MRGKDGAVEWSVGKLMAIVLAVVLLVIVIFGWSGAVKPLADRTGGVINEVLIFFGIRGDGGGVECIEEKVSDIRGGSELLDALGVTGSRRRDVSFKFCRSGECVLSGMIGATSSYFLDKGDLYGYNLKGEGVFVKTLSLGADRAKFYFELYNDVLELEGVRDFFEGRTGKQIILYAKGPEATKMARATEAYAVWQDGYWLIAKHVEKVSYTTGGSDRMEVPGVDRWDEIYRGVDDEDAIDAFAEVAVGKEIYGGYPSYEAGAIDVFSESDNNWAVISSIAVGGDGKLDSGEIDSLKSWFRGEALIVKGATHVDVEEYRALEAKVENEIVDIGGVEYSVGMNYNDEDPVVEVVSGNEKYRLRRNSVSFVERRMEEFQGLDVSDVSFVGVDFFDGGEWESVSDGVNYDVFSSQFNFLYRNSKMREFMEDGCR
jgi:hypothetical protein